MSLLVYHASARAKSPTAFYEAQDTFLESGALLW
jgi:hypothetical protein